MVFWCKIRRLPYFSSGSQIKGLWFPTDFRSEFQIFWFFRPDRLVACLPLLLLEQRRELSPLIPRPIFRSNSPPPPGTWLLPASYFPAAPFCHALFFLLIFAPPFPVLFLINIMKSVSLPGFPPFFSRGGIDFCQGLSWF